MDEILSAELVGWLHTKYEEILEEGRENWEGDNPHPNIVETAKDLMFDLEILKRLKIEAKEREGNQKSTLFCLLLSYYMIRVEAEEIQYTENFMQAAVETLNKHMAKKIAKFGRNK